MKRQNYKFLSKERVPVENRRFVTGKGNYVADINRPNMLHVAILPCHEPSAIIKNIDFSKSLKIKGVVDVVTGKELVNAINPLINGLDTPNVKRFPLAIDRVRYAGEWICAVVAETRAIAEDAMESDQDNSGDLDQRELEDAMEGVLGDAIPQKLPEEVMDTHDLDNSGTLDQNEVETAILESTEPKEWKFDQYEESGE